MCRADAQVGHPVGPVGLVRPLGYHDLRCVGGSRRPGREPRPGGRWSLCCSWCLCAGCRRWRAESGHDAGAGERVAEDAEHDAVAGIAFAAVQPPGVAQYQALAALQPEGFHVLPDNGAQQRNGGSGAGREPGEVVEPEPEACPLRSGRLQTGPRWPPAVPKKAARGAYSAARTSRCWLASVPMMRAPSATSVVPPSSAGCWQASRSSPGGSGTLDPSVCGISSASVNAA